MNTPGIDLSCCWGFPDDTPESGLPRLREYGFEGIELWPDPLTKFGAERWAAALAGNGLRCFQLCPYFNFVHGPAKIAESWRQLETFRQAARVLNCSRLRVFTGPPWGEGVIGPREATEAQWADAIRCLREFCEAAPDIEFCLECHAGSLMEVSPSALRLLTGVARPNLTTNLQLPLHHEDWQVSLNALTPYTTHIHIHNWTRALGEGELTFLADGVFDWRPVVRHLSRHGRSVCLSVEHVDHGGRHDPWETALRDGPFLQTLKQDVARCARSIELG